MIYEEHKSPLSMFFETYDSDDQYNTISEGWITYEDPESTYISEAIAWVYPKEDSYGK